MKSTEVSEKYIVSRWDEVEKLIRAGNNEGALFSLKSLANNGGHHALAEMAYIYERIADSDTDEMLTKAKNLYAEAAYKHGDEMGFLGLGRLYYYGRGVELDYHAALNYFESVSDNVVKKSLFLGDMYQYGKGVDKDFHKAEKYFLFAESKGYPFASIRLGVIKMCKGELFSGLKKLIVSQLKYIVRLQKEFKEHQGITDERLTGV